MVREEDQHGIVQITFFYWFGFFVFKHDAPKIVAIHEKMKEKNYLYHIDIVNLKVEVVKNVIDKSMS